MYTDKDVEPKRPVLYPNGGGVGVAGDADSGVDAAHKLRRTRVN